MRTGGTGRGHSTWRMDGMRKKGYLKNSMEFFKKHPENTLKTRFFLKLALKNGRRLGRGDCDLIV